MSERALVRANCTQEEHGLDDGIGKVDRADALLQGIDRIDAAERERAARRKRASFDAYLLARRTGRKRNADRRRKQSDHFHEPTILLWSRNRFKRAHRNERPDASYYVIYTLKTYCVAHQVMCVLAGESIAKRRRIYGRQAQTQKYQVVRNPPA